jgi:hypothetical protein
MGSRCQPQQKALSLVFRALPTPETSIIGSHANEFSRKNTSVPRNNFGGERGLHQAQTNPRIKMVNGTAFGKESSTQAWLICACSVAVCSLVALAG